MINLLITERGGYGGSASYLYTFLKFLDKEKFNPIVVLYNYSDAYKIQEIKKLGIKVEFLNFKQKEKEKTSSSFLSLKIFGILKYLNFILKFIKKDLVMIIKLIKIVKHKRISLILLNSDVHFHIPSVLTAKILSIPCIVRKSGVGENYGKKIRKILSRLVDVFIASSNAEFEKHIQNKFPYKKMVKIYEGVDINFFFPSNNNKKIHYEFGISQDQSIVGSISRIDLGKGHKDLILAANLVIKCLPNTIFLIVGDDFYFEGCFLRKLLQEEVEKMDISNNVKFVGWRDDILDILQDLDIFVHCPNVPEGLGIATLEALACGKPIVVTDNGGLAETAINGYNGYVIPPGDYKRLSESIISLLKDKNKREQMGINSRSFAEQEFNIEKNVKKIEQIFLETLNNYNANDRKEN